MLPPPLPGQVDTLERVLGRLSGDRHRAPPAVAVFDLDGTLLDTRPRTISILEEYAAEIAPAVPELSDLLAGMQLHDVKYLLSDTLRERGVVHPDHVRDITQYWRDRFYADAYVEADQPYPGAAEYVRACHEAGGSVVYLSSRDSYGMLLGTVASLRDRGFPIGLPGVELVFRADPGFSDEAFKRAILPTLARVGEVVAYFDNEPANCNLARACFPDAEVVLLETQKIPGSPLPDEGIEHLGDFRFR